jgi:hypothetical protein
MAGVSLLTALPLLLYFARYPYFFSFRMAYVANKGLGVVEGRPFLTWLLNVGRVIGGLFWQGETHLRHNLPGRPFLDPIQTILFLIGLVQSCGKNSTPAPNSCCSGSSSCSSPQSSAATPPTSAACPAPPPSSPSSSPSAWPN